MKGVNYIMSKYSKPVIEYVNLRAEEKLANGGSPYTNCIYRDGACTIDIDGVKVLYSWYEGNQG